MNAIAQLHKKDYLGFLLILLSSMLLGIWAVKGTIALRNILLGVELFYLFFTATGCIKPIPRSPLKIGLHYY